MAKCYEEVIDLTRVKNERDLKEALGMTRIRKDKARMVYLNVLDFRRGLGTLEAQIPLTDKEMLVFMGIGYCCVYRNIAYVDREDVQGFAGIEKSTYWNAFKKLIAMGLVIDSGITQSNRKCKLLFLHPDYFYCGSEVWRRDDLKRWSMGMKTLGIEC